MFLKVLFNTTMTSNTDKSRTLMLVAPTIDTSPQKAVLSKSVVQGTEGICNANATKLQ